MTKAELEARVEELEEEVASLESDNEELRDEVDTLERENERLEDQLDEQYQEGRDEDYANAIEDATRAVENLA